MAVEDFQVFLWNSVHCAIQSTTVYGVRSLGELCMLYMYGLPATVRITGSGKSNVGLIDYF